MEGKLVLLRIRFKMKPAKICILYVHIQMIRIHTYLHIEHKVKTKGKILDDTQTDVAYKPYTMQL